MQVQPQLQQLPAALLAAATCSNCAEAAVNGCLRWTHLQDRVKHKNEAAADLLLDHQQQKVSSGSITAKTDVHCGFAADDDDANTACFTALSSAHEQCLKAPLSA